MKILIALFLIPFRFIAATVIFLGLFAFGFLVSILSCVEKKSAKPIKEFVRLVKSEFYTWLKYPVYPLVRMIKRM